MNIGIILAAGNSSRFNGIKQLHWVNGKPLVNHSIDVMTGFMDDVIVITNSMCYEAIKGPIVLVNDIDCRLQSIKVALDYIGDKPVDKIIIHDAARPFITDQHIIELLCSNCDYAQYYLKLVNGLVKKTENGWEIAPREDFIELVTPQIIDYKLFDFAFRNYILSGFYCEILGLTELLGIKYNLIEGSLRQLRKITTIDDLWG